MVAIRRNILRKTITYMLIGALTVTTLTSIYTQSVFAEEETIRESGSRPTGGTSDNPYTGSPDNVFDLCKNSWMYLCTQLGFFVNDMCTFDLNSIGVGALNNTNDFVEYLKGHNMTTDDVVESYDKSTGTVNLSINYVKNVYNDVLDAVQEDEGWYWSSGKSGMGYLSSMQTDVYRTLKEKALNSKAYFIIPSYKIYNNANVIDKSRITVLYVEEFYLIKGSYYSVMGDKPYYKGNPILSVCSVNKKSDIINVYGRYSNNTIASDDVSGNINFIKCNEFGLYSTINYFTYTLERFFGYVNSNNAYKEIIGNIIYGPRQKVFTSLNSYNVNNNNSGVLIQSINDNLSSISIKLDNLNRDWLKVNNEIKDLIDDYMKDFQDYTEKQDKIDAAISSTLATMNENLAAGKEDLIGAIKESAAVQQLWLERIYNKEVEIYTKYLEENEQTQAVLVGIANQLKEYFEASLKNQGNYLTYDQFAAYAQQIIDAINNSGGSSGTGTDGSAVDMSTVDEYIKKIYEKEVNLYDELQAISKKLDNINDNLTKYLWNTDKSIPFLADIANLIKDGFEKCTAPLDILSEKLDELINLAKSILAVLSLNTLIDSLDRTKSDDEEENASIFTLIKMIMYLVLILGSLVVLFLKILQYIVLMFQIPAEPALFNENILLGWNYANSICIPGTSFSIIAFLRLLMYITVIFTVVKVLRRAINNGSIGVIK